MLYSLKGFVNEVSYNSIVIDVNGVGYEVMIATTRIFEKDEEVNILVIEAYKENEIQLIGFNTLSEKDMYLKLTSVQGVGPKTASSILRLCSLETLIGAIVNQDIGVLSSLPLLSRKCAQQLVIDLANKLKYDENYQANYQKISEVMNILHQCGYKKQDYLPLVLKLDSVQEPSGLLVKKVVNEINGLYGN